MHPPGLPSTAATDLLGGYFVTPLLLFKDALTITKYPYVTSGVSVHDTCVPVLDTFVGGIPVLNKRPAGGLPIFYASR